MNTPDTITVPTTNGCHPVTYCTYDAPGQCGIPVERCYFGALLALDAGGLARLHSADDNGRTWIDDGCATVADLPAGWVETTIEDRTLLGYGKLAIHEFRACYPSEVE